MISLENFFKAYQKNKHVVAILLQLTLQFHNYNKWLQETPPLL